MLSLMTAAQLSAKNVKLSDQAATPAIRISGSCRCASARSLLCRKRPSTGGVHAGGSTSPKISRRYISRRAEQFSGCLRAQPRRFFRSSRSSIHNNHSLKDH